MSARETAAPAESDAGPILPIMEFRKTPKDAKKLEISETMKKAEADWLIDSSSTHCLEEETVLSLNFSGAEERFCHL